jgi:4-hydroxybenzoyl-CoA reductase subunit beta
MQLPRFQFVRPDNLADGLAALAEHGEDAKIMSGGTDLLVNMKFRLDNPKVLISLNAVPEMQKIERLADGNLYVGAGCKLTDLAKNSLISESYPVLHDAIVSVGSRHVRNIATLGGNLCLDTRCWYTNQSENWRATRDGCFKTDAKLCHAIKTATRCHAINSSDIAPVLITLDAKVVLTRYGSERQLSALDFYHDDGVLHTALKSGEVLTAVIIPPPRGRAVFAKLAQRTGLDFAAGTFAAAVSGRNEQPDTVRLVMGSVAPAPKLLDTSERILIQRGLTDEAIDEAAMVARDALGKITNLFTPAGYKRRLVKALIKDALLELRGQE